MMLGDDITYLLEVLAIRNGETEDQLDERLREEARELGVDVKEQKTQDRHIFPAYLPEFPRRSGSIDSRASQSTGVTSDCSDFSKDQAPYHGHRRPSRVSLSFRDYDAFLSRGRPNGRQSISFSPLSTPSHSTFSLPLSQPPSPDLSPKKHFRRIRGLSMLKLRTGSDASLNESCPHCPQDASSLKRAVHKLPCGHRLCTQALRNTIKVATNTRTGAVPSCCGRPIPGGLVENVMTQEEQNALLEKLELWDEAVSLAPSVGSSRRDSLPSIPNTVLRRPGALSHGSRGVSEESRLSSLPAKHRKEVEQMMGREDYKLLCTGQSSQRDRFLKWMERQRHELESTHESLRDVMKAQHETAMDDVVEHHGSAIAEAEDKQVKAEADMRETQVQERRDNAAALKHMEAYCAGTFSNGEPHNRVITEQSLVELERARRVRDQMDAKHESQINVLRGEQGRRMRLRVQRQARELQDLQRQQRKEELELERMCTRDTQQQDESFTSKQRKIKWRWELQMAIFTKKIESETGLRLETRLPTAAWSRKERDSLQAPSQPVGDHEIKHSFSHSFAVGGIPRQQAHFMIGA